MEGFVALMTAPFPKDEEYYIKVSEQTDWQLPQPVLEALPNLVPPEDVAAAVQAYMDAHPTTVTRADLGYVHHQDTPLAVWDIIHPLPFDPSVTVTDSAGTVILTQINYITPNHVRSTAGGAFSGTARLS